MELSSLGKIGLSTGALLSASRRCGQIRPDAADPSASNPASNPNSRNDPQELLHYLRHGSDFADTVGKPQTADDFDTRSR